MHNLNLTFFKEYKIKEIQSTKSCKIDPTDHDKVYICHNNSISLISLSKQCATKIVDFPCEIIGFEYLSLNDELCIATEDGAVYVHKLSNGSQEEVTYCEDGIAAMQFSWDQETLVFVTKKGNVVVLNCAYDVANETNLLEDYFGEKQFINVGWGKEETQFQGSIGKKAILSKGQDLLDPETAQIDKENGSVQITWREDCEYFAVSFLNSQQVRMFKVFNKEGVLQFTSEKCSALQESIAWRPSGNWIAIPEIYRNKYAISLFEKNGLKHREIVLPFNFEDEFVTYLAWSNDSEILAIQTNQKGAHCLYLYTIGNYHWYLKQTLKFNSTIENISWSPRSSEKKTLYVLLENGHILTYQWNYIINHSLGKNENDQGVVGVVDGKNLLLTGFRGTVVPPPMCNFTLNHDKEINFVRFINEENENSNKFIIIDIENDVYMYECEFTTGGVVKCLNGVKKINSFSFTIKEQTPLKLHHWIFKNMNEIYFTDGKLLFFGKFSSDNEIDIQKAYELKKSNLGALNVKNNELHAHYSNGEVTKIDSNFQEFSLLKVGQFSSKFEVTDVGGNIVLLQPWQKLYLNEQFLESNVTSFAVVGKFLMFTTLETLKFVNLQTPQKLVVAERQLERGSKIVHVVWGTSKTILQLPRGNLETIHPRILSLNMIKKLLDNKSYRLAFDIMRKERINLNLLVDHNPNVFLESIDTFVNDIDNIQWINVFLTELQNIDVINDMYPYYHDESLEWQHFTSKNKVTFVCEKIIENLQGRNDSKYCLPLITCFVKKGETDNALKLIWDLKLSEDEAPNRVAATSSDEAFKYLLYLVNVNDLYNIALGLYDFGLVLYVAKRSQKDPKEYVPFLEELDKLEENYRRYKIDCHIKRFEKALVNISKCGIEKLDEALPLIEKHQLYNVALECYKTQEYCYKTVCSRYGDYLREKHKLAEASFMYQRAGDYQSAISSARNALEWKRCISLAYQNQTEEEYRKLLSSLLAALEGAGRFEEAVILAKNYISKSLAVDVMLRGKLYDEAILECYHEKWLNRVETEIKPSLEEYMSTLMLNIQEEFDLFKKQKQRLAKIRLEKANPTLDDDGKFIDDDMDLYSDTSSMNSSRYTASSGKTSKSSKNRRKHERKLFSLKEGSKFEDIALIDSLHKIVTKVHSTEQLKHIKTILMTATDLKLDDKARQLQNLYKNFTQSIKHSLNEIWIPEMIVSEEVTPVGGIINYDQIQKNQHYSLISKSFCSSGS
uniref:Elongator complex protein 1 n=1 Tax=Culicoides sonorensis TaxID=179676 RepID=A0A336MED4_CULSO